MVFINQAEAEKTTIPGAPTFMLKKSFWTFADVVIGAPNKAGSYIVEIKRTSINMNIQTIDCRMERKIKAPSGLKKLQITTIPESVMLPIVH